MRVPPRAGLVGGLAGVVALGAAVGLAAERYAVGRVRLAPDPDADEPFFRLPADRTTTVVADDGVRLHVEEVGRPDAPLTVVFAHGYTQEMAVWHYQRKALAQDGGLRLVFYDQRSHGRSGRSSTEHSTIDQLGSDLEQVLLQVVPQGPVVLVGHSMGGMTIMALAARAPSLFGSRVVGVGLISTSTGKLSELTFGLPRAITPVTRRVLPLLTKGLQKRPQVFERSRRLGSDLAFLAARRGGFGSGQVSPSVVEFVERMTANTPVEVIGAFYDTLSRHDKLEVLGALAGVPTLILVGDEDLLTPLSHSQAMSDALPDAQLVVVEHTGHMVALEEPALVTDHLRALLARATSAVPADVHGPDVTVPARQ